MFEYGKQLINKKKSFANRDSVPTLLPDLYSGTVTVQELRLAFAILKKRFVFR